MASISNGVRKKETSLKEQNDENGKEQEWETYGRKGNRFSKGFLQISPVISNIYSAMIKVCVILCITPIKFIFPITSKSTYSFIFLWWMFGRKYLIYIFFL